MLMGPFLLWMAENISSTFDLDMKRHWKGGDVWITSLKSPDPMIESFKLKPPIMEIQFSVSWKWRKLISCNTW